MFDFDRVINRHGSWCTQWDFVADRFGREDLLPFTISDMDFATAPAVITALQQRIAHGVLGYSRWQHPDFLSAVAHWYQHRFNTSIDPQQIVYGPSVIYMVAQTIRLWSRAGDGIAIHTPAYDAFYKAIEGNGRRVFSLPLERRGNEWFCNMSEMEAILARDECKVLLLCSPHNPTGKVWRREELEKMSAQCQRYNVRVISDEIHMDMILGDQLHTPWSTVAGDRWALFTSASKSFNVPALTGAYGFISDEQDRQAWFRALKEADGLSSPAVLAVAAHIAAYQAGEAWLDALREYLKGNLQWVATRLNQAFPSLNWHPPQATYLAWIDLSPLGLDDHALQQELIENQQVAIMPGYTYGPQGKGYLRLNVGCPRSKVEEGVNRLIAGIKNLL